jgi:hypothetical protein
MDHTAHRHTSIVGNWNQRWMDCISLIARHWLLWNSCQIDRLCARMPHFNQNSSFRTFCRSSLMGQVMSMLRLFAPKRQMKFLFRYRRRETWGGILSLSISLRESLKCTLLMTIVIGRAIVEILQETSLTPFLPFAKAVVINPIALNHNVQIFQLIT